MELKLKSTIQDTVDSAIITRRLCGIEKKRNTRRRVYYIVFLIISSCFLFLAIKSKLLIACIYTGVLVLFSCVNIIFAKRINNYYYKKHILKNFKIISKQYNHNFLEPTEFSIKVENGFVEEESLEGILKYSLEDYIKHFTEDRFCIFEFKNGKYIFINKEELSKDLLEEFCQALESRG